MSEEIIDDLIARLLDEADINGLERVKACRSIEEAISVSKEVSNEH